MMFTTRRPRSKAMMFASFAACTFMLALVIWIKLRVVTTVPRMAYVDPKPEPPAGRE